MQIQYGRSPICGNLGDELNLWLWPELFGVNVFSKNDSTQFLGIGSILSSDPIYNMKWINQEKKIIFGTGIRIGASIIPIDSTFDVMFLRGPLSNYTLGNRFNYITDSAYCLQFTHLYEQLLKTKKIHKIGLIPYFRSDDLVPWKDIAKKLGMHYISTRCEQSNLIDTLKEIASCELIVSEAMHGAIIADILRIPWSRFVLTTYKWEGSNVADYKWMDWMYSLNIANEKYPVIRLTNKINHAIYKLSNRQIQLNAIFKKSLSERIVKELDVNQLKFSLSDVPVFETTANRLKEQILRFKEEYCK